MTILPTLEGGLRLDIESPLDWLFLRCIPADARSSSTELADRLGDLMSEDPGAEDWREYVLPDLRAQFDGQITMVEEALKSSDDGLDSLLILRADGERWYGVLNQARLALEGRYHFDRLEQENREMTPGELTAWYRYRMYLSFQYQLLRFVMR